MYMYVIYIYIRTYILGLHSLGVFRTLVLAPGLLGGPASPRVRTAREPQSMRLKPAALFGTMSVPAASGPGSQRSDIA